MHNILKYTCFGCLFVLLMATMVYGDNNVEEALSIYLDARNEIQNLLTLAESHADQFNDFENKLLGIQKVVENFETRFLELEKRLMTAMDEKLQTYNTKLEGRLSVVEANYNTVMRTVEEIRQMRHFHNHNHAPYNANH